MEFQLERHTQIILAVVSYAQTPPQVYRNVLSAEGLGEGLKIVSADRRRQSHPKRCGSSPRLNLAITTEHQTHHLWGSAKSVELRRWMGSASQIY